MFNLSLIPLALRRSAVSRLLFGNTFGLTAALNLETQCRRLRDNYHWDEGEFRAEQSHSLTVHEPRVKKKHHNVTWKYSSFLFFRGSCWKGLQKENLEWTQVNQSSSLLFRSELPLDTASRKARVQLQLKVHPLSNQKSHKYQYVKCPTLNMTSLCRNCCFIPPADSWIYYVTTFVFQQTFL